MKPTSLSEHLMFCTVRLETPKGTGTGSFFIFNIDQYAVPVIITNKHVVNDNPDETVTFLLHICDENGDPGGNIHITFSTHWYFHENKDICFCYVHSIVDELEHQYNKKVFFRAFSENQIPSKDGLQELKALEDLVMVGYPIGLWDEKNNLPIFRKGFTACHPAIDFNEEDIGLIDMACFPGSSGSPILILNEGSYLDRNGTMKIGTSRAILLGYLFAGPTYNASGDMVTQAIPTVQPKFGVTTPMMVNLGYYIKSIVLDSFRAIIVEDIKKNPPTNVR